MPKAAPKLDFDRLDFDQVKSAAERVSAYGQQASDIVAQRIVPETPLPVGVVTGAVGGIYLVWLLAAQWRESI